MSADVKDVGSRIEISVTNTVQKHSWDCGLACAVTCLNYLCKDSSQVYDEDLKALGCGQSVWTIDLAHLMSVHKVRHLYCTTLLGVDQTYSNKSFYSRNFSDDESRVNQLFDEASSLGICVEQRSVAEDEIISHIHRQNILIVLVDWAFLECIWCDLKICPSLNCFRGCCQSYQGHFVVVCGVDKNKGHIYYKNPAYKKELCCSRLEKFHIARKSHGTDEDIIFLYKD